MCERGVSFSASLRLSELSLPESRSSVQSPASTRSMIGSVGILTVEPERGAEQIAEDEPVMSVKGEEAEAREGEKQRTARNVVRPGDGPREGAPGRGQEAERKAAEREAHDDPFAIFKAATDNAQKCYSPLSKSFCLSSELSCSSCHCGLCSCCCYRDRDRDCCSGFLSPPSSSRACPPHVPLARHMFRPR